LASLRAMQRVSQERNNISEFEGLSVFHALSERHNSVDQARTPAGLLVAVPNHMDKKGTSKTLRLSFCVNGICIFVGRNIETE
jgi:hypothetical protein